MIKDITGIPLVILIAAGVIDCGLIAYAFKYFLRKN